MKLRMVPGVTSLLLSSVLPLSSVYAQDTKPAPPPADPAKPAPTDAPKKIDQEVLDALNGIAAAQQALKSYSATMNFDMKQGQITRNVTAEIQYAVPNKYHIVATQPSGSSGKTTVQVTSDGAKNYLLSSADSKSYRAADASPNIQNIASAFMLMGSSGLMFGLLTEKEVALKLLSSDTAVATFGPEETVDGVVCRILNATMAPTPAVTLKINFAFGKEDSLLRRVTVEGKSAQGDMSMTETYTNVKANPELTPDAFTFTPPPGAKLAEPPKSTPLGNNPFDPRLKVGANPLPFSGKDMGGKSITLAAYRGKVVLIDFWATWCGPCVAELPNVIKVYNKYHTKGFEVIGVSLDEKGDKAKVASFTTKNKMPWPQIYDGGGWESALAVKYGIQAIPFTLLVGKNGKIVAVGARGEALEPAVQKALSAK